MWAKLICWLSIHYRTLRKSIGSKALAIGWTIIELDLYCWVVLRTRRTFTRSGDIFWGKKSRIFDGQTAGHRRSWKLCVAAALDPRTFVNEICTLSITVVPGSPGDNNFAQLQDWGKKTGGKMFICGGQETINHRQFWLRSEIIVLEASRTRTARRASKSSTTQWYRNHISTIFCDMKLAFWPFHSVLRISWFRSHIRPNSGSYIFPLCEFPPVFSTLFKLRWIAVAKKGKGTFQPMAGRARDVFWRSFIRGGKSVRFRVEETRAEEENNNSGKLNLDPNWIKTKYQGLS